MIEPIAVWGNTEHSVVCVSETMQIIRQSGFSACNIDD